MLTGILHYDPFLNSFGNKRVETHWEMVKYIDRSNDHRESHENMGCRRFDYTSRDDRAPILAKEENMAFALTYLNHYVTNATNAYADYRVFDDLYVHYRGSASQSVIPEPNTAALGQVVIDNYIATIVYSAFAFEAYANLLGNSVLPTRFFSKYLDRLSVMDKLSAVLQMKSGTIIDAGSVPFQSIEMIRKDRDKLAHDKGKQVATIDEYKSEEKKRQLRADPKKALSALLSFDEYLSEIGCDVEFLNSLTRNSIGAWMSAKAFYIIGDDLLYSNARFPDEHEYILAVRRHTGFKPKGYIVDESRKTIAAEQGKGD